MIFTEFVENKVTADSSDRTQKSACASFLKSSVTEVAEESLRGWIVDMIIAGLRPATRTKYVSIIATLYKEWGGGRCDAELFDSVKELTAIDVEDLLKRGNANLNQVKCLLRVDGKSVDFEIINIFLYLLFDVNASLKDVINLKRGDSYPDISQLADIVETMSLSTRKKYLFGLGQGKKREGQIISELLHHLSGTLTTYGFDFGSEFSRDSITSIWIAAALNAGVSAYEICMTLNNLPGGYSFLEQTRRSDIQPDMQLLTMQRVADSIHCNTRRWFVMKMRFGNTADDIKAAIDSTLETELGGIAYYSPSHTVVSVDKEGRRRRVEKPYIPGILFFRMRQDKVRKLFSHIGDLAWCYKWSNTPDSAYCTIPSSEMKAFQAHVGSFTPDIKMELVTRDTALPVDSAVRINGGGVMENHVGIICSVKNNNGTRTYTLALSDREYATWTVKDIEEIYIEPIQ